MQPRYVMMMWKDGHLDSKHSKNFRTKEELDAAFEAAKIKYQAVEDKDKESTFGIMGTVGLFKFANGQNNSGKPVNLEYSEIQNMHTCIQSLANK